jgi:hypothetical protein
MTSRAASLILRDFRPATSPVGQSSMACAHDRGDDGDAVRWWVVRS